MHGQTLTYDQVQPADGARRAPVTDGGKALDIISKRLPLGFEPAHCACRACELGMPHVRRTDGLVIGS